MFELKNGDNLWDFFSNYHKYSFCSGSGIVGGVYVKYHFHDIKQPLVVTFSNAGEITKTADVNNSVYSPWGFDFVRSYGVNTLSFSCFNSLSWYRELEFQQFLKLLSKHLTIFNIRLGYGSSMGGFAVSAFSNCLGFTRQLLMNPISSLSTSLAPWETRFIEAQKLNWNDDFSDGAKSICESVIVYDPLFKLDSLHARRYKNSTLLKLPGVGHSIPSHLSKLGVLKFTFEAFLYNKVVVTDFHKLVRTRRYYDGYYKWMLGAQNLHLTPLRQSIIKQHQKKIPKNTHQVIKKFNDNDIDLIRDLAIKLELINIEEAYKLMLLAHRLRPDGTFISEKLAIYKSQLRIA